MDVLVIDDEQKIRKIFSSLMQQQGFSVRAADSVAAAYDMMLDDPADLVLLDINMPEVDGIFFYDIATTFCKKSKFIVTSVYALADQRQMVPGADAYYDKSDSLAELVRKVRHLMPSSEQPVRG